MTRQQTIDFITARLATLDEQNLGALADMLNDSGASEPLRDLTAREVELIAQSRRDFAEGRTMTSAEVLASVRDLIKDHRANTRAT